MRRMQVQLNDFELVTKGPKKMERIKIVGDYPRHRLAEMLFSNLGLMHLVAPYLPAVIKTDFVVHPRMQGLIAAMYASEKHPRPVFRTPRGNWSWPILPKTDPGRAAVAYSGGKDSLWNVWWTQERYGSDNVIAVHLGGLNQGQKTQEAASAVRQSRALGFRLQTIRLLNSSGNHGHLVMRSRDMFLAGLIVPVAMEFGAGRVIIEGCPSGNPEMHFTERAENFQFFNRILKELGIPVRVGWRLREEIDVVRDLLKHRPRWLPLVCNCFSAACYKPFLRRSWQSRAPTLPLYESQCGSCFKCRTVNLGRVLYDPVMQGADPDDIRDFLRNTHRWMRENRERMADIMGESFVTGFNRAVRRYGLSSLAVA
jgi:hypothetical protein